MDINSYLDKHRMTIALMLLDTTMHTMTCASSLYANALTAEGQILSDALAKLQALGRETREKTPR